MMEVEGSSTPMNRAPDHSSFLRSRRSKALYQFKQQKLPACKPVLTPTSVITVFLLMGFVFIPIGFVTLRASRDAIEIIERYDVECIPEEYRNNKLSYITDSSISKNCTRYLKVQKHMKAPIFIYYQLDNYYQNHRRYVKSRSDQQLLHGLEYSHTSSCEPEELSNGLPIVPCGLIAWSMFNDTFTFARESTKLKINRNNISWKSDRDHKFGKNVYPLNFQNGTLIGGAKLDPIIPLSDQEDFIVWMRAAALLSFRKLYGKIEEDLEPGNVVVLVRRKKRLSRHHLSCRWFLFHNHIHHLHVAPFEKSEALWRQFLEQEKPFELRSCYILSLTNSESRKPGGRKKNGQGIEVCSNMGRGSTKAYCISSETTATILKFAKA